MARLRLSLLVSLFVFAASALAADGVSSCLELALLNLTDEPLISQSDPLLAQKGLIPDRGESLLCGPTCGHYLMKAVRNAFHVSSKFKSAADEIEDLAKEGNTFGRKVATHGMVLGDLRDAISRNLSFHGIRATVDGVTDAISISALIPPTGFEQATIIGAGLASEGGQGHLFLIQHIKPIDSKSCLALLLNPADPGREIIVKIATEERGALPSRLVLMSPSAKNTSEINPDLLLAITGVLRVRMPH